MKKAVLIAILAIATATVAMAQVGKEFYDGNSVLYFRVTSLNPNEVEVINYPTHYSNYTGDIDIPSSVSYGGADYSVTAIGDGAFDWYINLITSVNIPNSVTKIGKSAFPYEITAINVSSSNPRFASDDGILFSKNMDTLICYPRGKTNSTYTIPGSVTTIGEGAFVGCWSLTSIDIPNSVKTIGWEAFWGCGSLTAVNIGNSVTEIGNQAFYKCSSLTSINIPNSVITIGNSAFNGCSSLTTVNIGNSVNTIGSSAFAECSKLTSIDIPNSVTEIGEGAFLRCSSLTSVNIGNSVNTGNPITKIGDSAFSRCSSLTTLNIGNSVNTIGSYAFRECSSLTSINIPNSVTEIGDYAFNGCSSLTTANIGNSVTSIGNQAFENCSKLTSIDIPNSVTSIGNQAFSGCSSLTTVNIGNSVNTIGHQAFENCSKLTSIDIPNSVTSIGHQAFARCGSLTTVNIGNSVKIIGYLAFQNCSSLTSINIPNSVIAIDSSVFAESGIADINVDSSNPRFASDNGILFSKNMDTLICYPQGKTNSTYTIPGSVKTIGYRAFRECSSLTSINIPNSVITIVRGAFAGCSSLASINIPNSVTSIGDEAFSRCSKLISVNIPDSVKTIGSYAFSRCSKLISVNIPNSVKTIGEAAFDECRSLTTVNIGNSVTSIGNSAFYGCSSLTSVNIPNSVTKIGHRVFNDCRKLISVNIGNSVTEIGSWAFANCSKLKKIKIDVTNPASITMERDVFIYIPKGASADACILLVPPGSVPQYSNAPQWKEFMPNIFEPQNFAITYNQPAGGTLAILNDDDDSSIPSGSQVEHGDVIKIVATPDNNYHLDSIKVNGTLTANNSTITIKQHTTIEAFFSLNKYRIEYWVTTDGGTLVVLNAADNSIITYNQYVEHGTIIKIEATPKNGYFHLSKIVVNDEPFTGTEITVERDTYIYAEFASGTGIDHSDYTALSIYPTLAGEYITVATEGVSLPVSVTVTDLSGHTVATAIATGSKTEINISHLSAGTYIVRIGDKVGKVVKR